MIKAEAIVVGKHEHCREVKIETTVLTTKSLIYPEIVTLLVKCYETDPEITLNAIEGALDKCRGDNND